MNKVVSLLLIIGLSIMGCGKEKKEVKVAEEPKVVSNEEEKPSVPQKEVAVITTEYGDMVVEFFEGSAPKHVESFKKHAKDGYYDGTIFHRVIPGFMIQGGDILSRDSDRENDGLGGPGWTTNEEFSDLKHKRGILSMARGSGVNSAGSQFFICVADAPFLNNKYTVFGKVVSGLDVVDQIVNAPRDPRDNPNDRIEMKVRLNAAVKSASSNQGGGGTFGFILLVLIIAAIVYYRVIYKKAG